MTSDPVKTGARFVGGAGIKSSLLVIGSEHGFSPLLTDYSLGLAQRMGYSIMAVNLLLAGKRKKRHLMGETGRRELLDFQTKAEAAARTFMEKASAMGIAFRSGWAIGELDAEVREIIKKDGNIDLALSEPEYFAEDEEDRQSIPAFTFTD